MAGYYGGERNVPGAVGNIGGTANGFLAGNPSFDVNKTLQTINSYWKR